MSVRVLSRTRPCLLLLLLILAAPIIAAGAAIGRGEGRAERVTGDDDPILIPRSVASGSFTLDSADISALDPETTGSVKKRGVPRADDRKVLNGIYWRLRTGSPWADIPERYGPPTTCANRFRRWGKIGVWDRIFEAVSRAYDGNLQMIDSSSIRVHQHGAT